MREPLRIESSAEVRRVVRIRYLRGCGWSGLLEGDSHEPVQNVTEWWDVTDDPPQLLRREGFAHNPGGPEGPFKEAP